MKYLAQEIKNWGTEDFRTPAHNGVSAAWIPARPLNHKYDHWRDRIKWAWCVLIGRYDALDWQ